MLLKSTIRGTFILLALITFFIPANAVAQHLQRVASYDSLTHPVTVMVEGNYAYIADGRWGLVILDISDPYHPVLTGGYNPPFNEFDLFVRNGIVYMANGLSEPYMGKFYIVDATNPSSPVLLSELGFNWEIIKIFVVGDYAYTTSFGSNPIIDISDPANPQVVGDLSGYPLDFAYDSLLYVANGLVGLSIYDLGDPPNPQLLGNCDTPGQANAVALDDAFPGYAYVTDWDSVLQVIDVSTPSAPHITGGLGLGRYNADMDVSGSYAFIAATDSGLYVANISDPAAPSLFERDYGPNAISVDYANGYIYLGCRGSLQIYSFDNPTCDYLPGDLNGNGVFNGIDVTFMVRYFRSGPPPPPIDCHPYCPTTPDPFYAAGDVNGDCAFNGLDVTYFVNYLKGGPLLRYCPQCPPTPRFRHDDIRGDCLTRAVQDSGYMVLEAVGDDLHIHHMDAFYQCCLGYLVEYQFVGNDITAVEYDTNPPCDCMCYFDLESIVYDLPPDEYHVTLIGINGDTIGVDTIRIGGR